jgi:hypothetical protein
LKAETGWDQVMDATNQGIDADKMNEGGKCREI